MTGDMFETAPLKQNLLHQKSLMARQVFDSVFLEENLTETSNIEGMLPKVTLTGEGRGIYTLKSISVFEKTAAKFIYDLIYLEIDATQDLEIDAFCSLPFRFFELDTKKYLVTETVISSKDLLDMDGSAAVVKGLQKQMELGLRSNFYARMVMEMKGRSLEGKTSYVQERIVSYIHRFPKLYDYDLIPLMNEFMSRSKELYTKNRAAGDLSKVIVALYYCLNKVRIGIRKKGGGVRHIHVKTSNVFVEELFGRKKVVGVMVALSYLSENEVLGREHLLKACKNFIRGAVAVDGTYLEIVIKGQKSKLFYVELSKKEGTISAKEKGKLEHGLAEYLEAHIQKLARKIFMPQNTEEVMKYTVSLSKELRSKDDYPQVAVLFDSQVNDSLIFTAIVVRSKVQGEPSAFAIFDERVQKKYTCYIKHVRKLGEFKEGLEVSYKMKIKFFMREDYTIDIYLARSKIVQDLQKRFGVIRDYNGGMLEKQGGILSECQMALKKKGIKNAVLVENFFHAIHPSEMRAIMDTESFLEFFMFFFDLFTYKISKDTVVEVTTDKILFVARVKSEKKKEAFVNEIRSFDAPIGSLVSFSLRIQEKFYLGVKLTYQDEDEKTRFLDKMSICLKL